MALPSGDGVITREARGAYRLILFVAGWFIAGVAATIAAYSFLVTAPAHASANQSVDLKLEVLLSDVSAIKRDMAIVKCRLNLENICPP